MAEATEVIACPACNHLLRVPLDWLGQVVQCPECRATFKAPTRVGDTLTAPELISRPEAPAPASARRWDVMLMMPAFGLLLCGVAGAVVDGGLLAKLLTAQDGGRAWAKTLVSETQKQGFGEAGPADKQDQQDEAAAGELLGVFRVMFPLSLAVSIVVFACGLSIIFGWSYRLAQLGCVLAMINVVGLCCVPGAAAGIWGLFMLASEEGRRHFQR